MIDVVKVATGDARAAKRLGGRDRAEIGGLDVLEGAAEGAYWCANGAEENGQGVTSHVLILSSSS